MHRLRGATCLRGAFTLVELLVVIAVISLLLAILLPAVGRARDQARAIAGMNNQRQIVHAISLFAMDNDDNYPESVATIGGEPHWNWHEPTKLIGYRARSPRLHRSLSGYLRAYLPDGRTVYCPSAPRRYRYLEEAWAAGDSWDNPDTSPVIDPLTGTYCLYWNYVGYVGPGRFFEGPRGPAGGAGRNTPAVSCYFGYSQYLSRGAYASCQKFRTAGITEGSDLSAAYWSGPTGSRPPLPDVKLYAGYTDGRVESYSSRETAIMRVIRYPATGEPYPPWLGPGEFLVPRGALP